MRFGYKEEDMESVWAAIRTSLVQKVTDVRKSIQRKSLTPSSDHRSSLTSASQENVDILDKSNSDMTTFD
jgi:hypothetical protein